MNLGQFKDYIEKFPKGKQFEFSISDPFSWRGVYAEVAFTVEEIAGTKEDILSKIDKALTEEFIGWKGGEFYYNAHTEIHFEREHGAYSDGGYENEWISKILVLPTAETQQKRLVKLLFPTVE